MKKQTNKGVIKKKRIIKRFTEELEDCGFNTNTRGARVAKRVLLEIVDEEVSRELREVKKFNYKASLGETPKKYDDLDAPDAVDKFLKEKLKK